MSSDEIIGHIIRDITARSTQLLKKQRAFQIEKSVFETASKIVNKQQPEQTVVLPPLPNDTSNDLSSLKITQQSETLANTTEIIDGANQESSANADAIRQMFFGGIQSNIAPFHVTETLAAFTVRAVVLDPKNNFRISDELSKDEVNRLINVILTN